MSAFFSLAAVAIIISLAIEKYSGVIAFAGVLLLGCAILVYTKYVAVKFYYDVMLTDEGEALFIVRQLSGRREITLCRVSLADIVDIKKESAKERRAHRRAAGVALFVYFPTLAPETNYRLTVGRGSELSEVMIECSDEFAALLSEYACEARENITFEDEG